MNHVVSDMADMVRRGASIRRIIEGDLHVSLRFKIMGVILAAILVSDLVATWALNDRLLAGARREADVQAHAQTAQVSALYTERAATLAAEGEAISLYPAVITALADGNPQPFIQWSSSVAQLQATRVTVTDARGRVVARGHAPTQVGDNLAPSLAGLRMALQGSAARGVESGDELGLALRSYTPVKRGGTVLGVVMIADPLAALQQRLAGRSNSQVSLQAGTGAAPPASGCDTPSGDAARCWFPLTSPTGQPVSAFAVTVPLVEIAKARADAQRTLWVAAVAVLAVGALVAWALAATLVRPLGRLSAAAGRIAAGSYDEPTGVQAGDEIGTLAHAFDLMREQVARVTGELRRERDVLSAVLEAAGDGILVTSPSGATVLANEAWTSLLGGEGLGGAAALKRADDEESTLGEAAARWLQEPERVVSADFERPRPYQRLRCYSAPVRHRDGALIGRIFVLRDVTWESGAERLRSALVATVSHELRTPLTTIAGYTATLLHSGAPPGPEREMLEVVAQAADALGGLVDNLLDAATMDAGELRLEREPVRLERLARRLVEQRQRLAPAHTLVLEAEAGLPLADADPERVQQVLANLVDNAIKYSPGGGPIIVHVGQPGGPSQGEMLTVSVRDRGLGIAAPDAERLFERFYRVDSAAVRATRGVGLGLFICRRIVESHGGTIRVVSEPGVGSTFLFTLPGLAGARLPLIAEAGG